MRSKLAVICMKHLYLVDELRPTISVGRGTCYQEVGQVCVTLIVLKINLEKGTK